MAHRNNKKISKMSSGADLPDELVERIISHLPVKFATRAALVSRRFINSWKLSRDLCFDVSQQLLPQSTFASVIDGVMNQHSGPKIERLVLNIDPTGLENRICEWIQMAVTKGVQELDLNFFGGSQAYPISSDLIDVESIRVLKLHYCDLQFAVGLSGLRFLKTLHLEQIHLTVSSTQTIFSSCLVLANLELVNCHFLNFRMQIIAGNLKHFKSLKVVNFEEIHTILIKAPTLESLCYSGEVCSFVFGCDLPKLNVAAFNFGPNKRFQHIRRVTHLVSSLHYCKKLTICSKILEGLSPKFREYEYIEFPFNFSTLQELSLFLGGSNNVTRGTTFINPCDIVYFLKNCPVINKIFIDLGDYPFEEGLYWKLVAKERFEKCCPSFQFLKNLTMRGFKYRDLEFQLLKVIVENAASLEDVTLIKATITSNQTLERLSFLDWMRAQCCNFDVHEDHQNRRPAARSTSSRRIN